MHITISQEARSEIGNAIPKLCELLQGSFEPEVSRFSGELGMISFWLGREIFFGGGCNAKMIGNKLGGEKTWKQHHA